MKVIHLLKNIETEQRPFVGWHRYEIAYCGIKRHIGDDRTFMSSGATCKKCIKILESKNARL